MTLAADPMFDPDSGPWELLASMLPATDWTAEAIQGEFIPSIDAFATDEQITRALYRREHPHVLITGRKGVGKTTTAREVARRAAIGKIPFLQDRRFLWIDVADSPQLNDKPTPKTPKIGRPLTRESRIDYEVDLRECC